MSDRHARHFDGFETLGTIVIALLLLIGAWLAAYVVVGLL